MGYLTTVTIYNDGADQLKKHPEELAEVLDNACLGVYTNGLRGHNGSVGLGNHANLITVQKPRHASVKTVYVHAGNTVVEMNPYDKDTAELLERNPEFFDELLQVMEQNVKRLKKMKKESQK